MAEFDRDKVGDATLALLCLTMHGDECGTRAWKGFDWDTLDRLFEKGFIGNPKSEAKPVVVTEEGVERANRHFEQMFSVSSKG
jgi:hypothetical protein